MQEPELLTEYIGTGAQAKPFLKWTGGKAQLIPNISKAVDRIVGKWDSFTYIEPFVGSGSVLFWFLRKYNNLRKVVINDISRDLMTAYRVVKNYPHELVGILRTIERSYHAIQDQDGRRNFYLSVRSRFNEKRSDEIENTALLIFLNRTCYNGFFRVNRKGTFSVPFGKYENPRICDEENIMTASVLLQKAEILCGDFEDTIYHANGNSLFYFDPPDKPVIETSPFKSFSKNEFRDTEKIRLRNFCDMVNASGYKFVLSNSDIGNFDISGYFFNRLYSAYNINRVHVKSMIHSDDSKRGEIFELIIDNY